MLYPWWDRGRVVLVNKIPEKDKTIVRTRCENAAPIGGPLDGIESSRVTLKFEKCLARLANIQYPDYVGILGERCKKMGIVWRCYICQYDVSTHVTDSGLPEMRNKGGGQLLAGAEGLPFPGLITTKRHIVSSEPPIRH